jgi:hypothetical protein
VHGPQRAAPPGAYASGRATAQGAGGALCTLHLCGLRLAAPARRGLVQLARPAYLGLHYAGGHARMAETKAIRLEIAPLRRQGAGDRGGGGEIVAYPRGRYTIPPPQG